MRKIVVALLGLTLASSVGWVAPVFSADETGIEKNHALIAGLYEKEASRLKGLMDLHGVMKKDYQQRLSEGQAEQAERLKKAIQHCEMIIEEQKELYDDLVEFAQWHRKQ